MAEKLSESESDERGNMPGDFIEGRPVGLRCVLSPECSYIIANKCKTNGKKLDKRVCDIDW